MMHQYNQVTNHYPSCHTDSETTFTSPVSSRAGEDPLTAAASQAPAAPGQEDREEEGEAEANDEQRALLQGRDAEEAKRPGNEGT